MIRNQIMQNKYISIIQDQIANSTLPADYTFYPGLIYRVLCRVPFNIAGNSMQHGWQTDCVFSVDSITKVQITASPTIVNQPNDYILIIGMPETIGNIPEPTAKYTWQGSSTWSAGNGNIGLTLPILGSHFYSPLRVIFIDEIILIRNIGGANPTLRNFLFQLIIKDQNAVNNMHVIDNPVLSISASNYPSLFHWKANYEKDALMVGVNVAPSANSIIQIVGNTDGANTDTLNYTFKYRAF
jgi:hypothetical protein